MEREKITIGVVGLGLLGGSASLKLRESGFAKELVGYDINSTHIQEALVLGIIDVTYELEELCRVSDLVILAIPVNAALKVLPIIMNNISGATVVIDFGSTKQKICKVADGLPNRSQYVACHPIAGTENTGPSAAFSELLENKVNIICDREGSSEEAIDLVIRMTEALGMRLKFMDSKSHDRHIAYVSHLSHISSFTLGQTVLEVEKDEEIIFDMAGSGFASTVRLAKSSPEMWAPILTENADNILIVLDRYIKNLNNIRGLIKENKEEELNKSMKEINLIRKVLDGEKPGEGRRKSEVLTMEEPDN